MVVPEFRQFRQELIVALRHAFPDVTMTKALDIVPYAWNYVYETSYPAYFESKSWSTICVPNGNFYDFLDILTPVGWSHVLPAVLLMSLDDHVDTMIEWLPDRLTNCAEPIQVGLNHSQLRCLKMFFEAYIDSDLSQESDAFRNCYEAKWRAVMLSL